VHHILIYLHGHWLTKDHAGIGMGGIWGLATSTSLENLPVELRGIASGLLQEGYAFGNLVRRVMRPLSSMLICPSF
jgi:MFS family permease